MARGHCIIQRRSLVAGESLIRVRGVLFVAGPGVGEIPYMAEEAAFEVMGGNHQLWWDAPHVLEDPTIRRALEVRAARAL
ncbi:MAG: hypothetical protein GXP34_04560 [Actinobacteria bacterium]|nr:hypothetical protein [Actinomycetota bacterium]